MADTKGLLEQKKQTLTTIHETACKISAALEQAAMSYDENSGSDNSAEIDELLSVYDGYITDCDKLNSQLKAASFADIQNEAVLQQEINALLIRIDKQNKVNEQSVSDILSSNRQEIKQINTRRLSDMKYGDPQIYDSVFIDRKG